MTKEEKIKRIEEIEQKIFDIEIGSDFLSLEQHVRLGNLHAEKRQLEEEVEEAKG